MKLILLAIIVVCLSGCRQDQSTKIILEQVVKVEVLEYRTGIEINNWIYEKRENIELVESIFSIVDRHTKNRDITKSIFKYSIEYDVPVGLALGLAWSESRFDHRAINGHNNRNNTKDYGLFQLNDGYRNWSKECYFDIEKNSEEGIGYLSYMLKKFDGKEIIALGAYNSGATGVKRGVGYTTLLHIDNILSFKQMIEREINEVMVE